MFATFFQVEGFYRNVLSVYARWKGSAVKRMRGEKEIFCLRLYLCRIKLRWESSIILYFFATVRQTNRENLNPLLVEALSSLAALRFAPDMMISPVFSIQMHFEQFCFYRNKLLNTN